MIKGKGISKGVGFGKVLIVERIAKVQNSFRRSTKRY